MKREEVERPLRHPLEATHEEIVHLVDVAERGESAATPSIIIGGLSFLLAPLAAAIIAAAFGVGYLATRGNAPPASAHAASTAAPCPGPRAGRRPASVAKSHTCSPGNQPVGRLPSTGVAPILTPSTREALMETFWTIVAYTVLSGLFVLLPCVLVARLWRAAGRQGTAALADGLMARDARRG